MRRAIVHIGLPRTGTTSLQHLLAGERVRLGRAGILYPELTPASAGERHLSHQHLGEALDGRRPRRELTELLEGLAGAVDGHEVVILSYEGLCLLPWWRRAPQRLTRLFADAGYAMEVAATVKPQAELLNSAYTWRAQFLREARPFAAFLRAEMGRRRWDIGRLIGRWAAACDGRMTVVPVRDRRSDASLADRFLHDLRLPFAWTGEAAALRANPSPGPLAIAADLALHRRGAGRHPDPRSLTRATERLAWDAGYDRTRFTGLTEADRAAVGARWQPVNDRLAQAAWGCPWAAVVAEETPRPPNELLAPDPATGLLLKQIVREAEAGDRA